ncbi:MAG: MCE family protein [Fimbriimonadaceae bacterium]|nr:MCE family protein [Fimbriimonadaceae bacterium]
MQGAWKVGLLVIVFVGLLFGAYEVLGKSLFAKPSKTIYAEFADASGLQIGSNVTMAGVRIGNVTAIELTAPDRARVAMTLQDEIKIPEGTTAQIASSLIGFGDSPVVLVPPAGGSTGYLASGATIMGSKPSPLGDLLPDMTTTLQEVNKTLIATRALLEDDKMKGNLLALLETSNKTIEQFGKLATSLDSTIAENRSSVRGLMASLGQTMTDVQKATQYALKLVQDPKFKDEAQAILASLNRTAASAEKLIAGVEEMVNDPKMRDSLNNTVGNVEKITDSGTRIAENTEKMTKDGTLISENGVKISENVVELTKKANELADEAKAVLEKLQKFFDKVPSGGPVKGLTTDMSLSREQDPNHWRTDLSATLPVGGGGSVTLGLWDAFESNKITAQYGRPLNSSLQYRYGIYASKPGVGVDYRLAPRLSLRGDLFDINDPRFDLRARIDFGNGLYGWVGADRIFDKSAFTIGVGIRK